MSMKNMASSPKDYVRITEKVGDIESNYRRLPVISKAKPKLMFYFNVHGTSSPCQS